MYFMLIISDNNMRLLLKNTVRALYHFQLLDQLFLKMITEYIYCRSMIGHLGSIIPPVLYRISLSAVERHTIEDLCNFIYAFV